VPIEYVLDRARQRLTIIARDPIGVPDVLAWLERQAADGAWAYSTLDDFRLVTWNVATEDVRCMVDQMARLSAVHGHRGPVAIVATQSALFGMARMYASLVNQAAELVEVFYRLAEAERWLDDRTRVT
jgi:hypothetical protein